ncbi:MULTISPECIES: hypothetical protein [unclassified Helicobacter]|uniref:hypothetical protein n=1 Tax=unclassified Helicobacter TaxID=2593540 RepID=UPI0011C03B86|nr:MULTISPECIES: hypothetical protein [unclassified Helicobacter]
MVEYAREAGNKAEFTSAQLEAERSFGFSQSDSFIRNRRSAIHSHETIQNKRSRFSNYQTA